LKMKTTRNVDNKSKKYKKKWAGVQCVVNRPNWTHPHSAKGRQ
jgi:hypothetical protein